MTHSVPRVSAIALGVAAFVSLVASFRCIRGFVRRARAYAKRARVQPLRPHRARPRRHSVSRRPRQAGRSPGLAGRRSLSIPCRHYAHQPLRIPERASLLSDNPVATAATGVAGGVADLGSIAAYPFYCFPNYGSCSVRVPYRY